MDRELLNRLRLLEEKIYCLEAIIDNISEGVLLTDRNYRISVFNPAKARMEHMKPEEVMGTVSWEAYSRSNAEISEHKRVFDTRKAIVNAYRPHAYVDDVPVYIYYSTYPVIKDGEVLGVFTISRNETILRELLYDTIEHKRRLREKALDAPGIEKRFLAPNTQFSFNNIVGNSQVMKDLVKDAQTIASVRTSIMITGETGTGKEVLAQSIHNFGNENKKFLAINCAAIPENLVESILFGSVKGAYTGALDKPGLFQEAEDGTLFLDEINSMNVPMQAKLLRALQEQCVRPVGSLKEYPIKCRLICASNEEPDTLIREKRMRQDLFYRLSGFYLTIPPLRARKEDIVDLAGMFIAKYNHEFHKNIQSMSPDLIDHLLNHQWPGNTRELQHVIQNMMLRARELDKVLDLTYYPAHAMPHTHCRELSAESPAGRKRLETENINFTLDEVQREIISRRLCLNNGNVSQTARDLGIRRQNLLVRMKRLGLDKLNLNQKDS